MNRRHGRAWALGLAGILAGCGKSGVEECLDLNQKQQYEEAARRCEEVYAAEGDARAGWQAALALFELGREDDVLAWVDRLEKDGKVHPGAWGVSALVHQQRGDLDAANRDYRRDLELHRAAGDHLSTADALHRLSYNAWRQSRYREAFLLAGETLEEAGKAQDRYLEIRSTEMLYSVLYAVGDLEGARQALEAAGRLTGEEDPVARAKFLANRGGVLVDEGKLALARRDLEQALELGAGMSDAAFFRRVQVNLTAIHLALGNTGDMGDMGDIARAAHHLEEAWKHSEPGKEIPTSLLYYRARVDLARRRPAEALRSLETALGQDPAPDWAWDLEHQRGRAEEALGRLAAAEAAYERSIGVVEEMRRELVFDDLKSWLLDRKRQPFEDLFLLQARPGRARSAETALATVERAQARTFLDAFLHANSSAGASKDKPWSSSSLQRIEGLESLLPAMSESPVASLQPIGQILTAFGDRHGLVYFEAGEGFWLLTVHGQRVRLHPPVPAEEVRRLGGRFLAHPEDSRTAERLGEMLLPPGSLPEKGSAIHVVADGILGNLPFAALRRDGSYLVEDHPVLFLPSLSALAALESRRGEAPGPPLVLADSRGDLPGAAAEGRQVAKRLGSPALVGRTAVSGELQKASRAGTLHLALHTGPGPRGAWLQLADRQVSASEIVAGRIGPRLVVLASCSSGVRPGRQMWGSLGAAFLAAGSRAVLASLWSVEDERARDFVLRFYAEGGTADPSGALARTQRVAIAEGRSPMFWAPFVLIGSDGPVDDIR
jgi:tetratricopeptide (TPR) repeat protein